MRAILLSILSAVFLILSFPKFDLGFLAWFALVPWFFAIRKHKPRAAFLLSYLVGLIFFSGILYWVAYVSRLGFVVLMPYLALYFAFFGLIFSIRYPLPTTRHLFFIPCIWVTLEYIRSHLLTGFGWALLGSSQSANLPVIQISDITGCYGVSFLIVMVNVAVWLVIKIFLETSNQKPETRRKILHTTCCILPTLILVLGYGYFRLGQNFPKEEIKVAVVQGNIPQGMKWDPQARDYILERYSRLTAQAAGHRPQLIVWPETSVPGYLEEDPELQDKLAALSRLIAPAYLLAGAPQADMEGRIYNSAVLIHHGSLLQRYDKLHLVPFGEFIPWPAFFSRFPFAGLIGNFTPGKAHTVFSLQDTDPEIQFSALICFEDVFAHLARRFVQQRARLLINITNDAWFGASSEPYQHLQGSVFRAVENRVNVVRSANTGVSCFINPWGKILSRVADASGQDILIEGEQSQLLQVVAMSSFYTAFGDVFAWLCILLTLFVSRARTKY